jgi:hypothetical protein
VEQIRAAALASSCHSPPSLVLRAATNSMRRGVQSRCRCGRGDPSLVADLGGGETRLAADRAIGGRAYQRTDPGCGIGVVMPLASIAGAPCCDQQHATWGSVPVQMSAGQAKPCCRCRRGAASPGADESRGGPIRSWGRCGKWAQSRSRCGRCEPTCGADESRDEPSPGAAVSGVSPVPVQMWQG